MEKANNKIKFIDQTLKNNMPVNLNATVTGFSLEECWTAYEWEEIRINTSLVRFTRES